jgi:hypothetical protein
MNNGIRHDIFEEIISILGHVIFSIKNTYPEEIRRRNLIDIFPVPEFSIECFPEFTYLRSDEYSCSSAGTFRKRRWI